MKTDMSSTGEKELYVYQPSVGVDENHFLIRPYGFKICNVLFQIEKEFVDHYGFTGIFQRKTLLLTFLGDNFKVLLLKYEQFQKMDWNSALFLLLFSAKGTCCGP